MPPPANASGVKDDVKDEATSAPEADATSTAARPSTAPRSEDTASEDTARSEAPGRSGEAQANPDAEKDAGSEQEATAEKGPEAEPSGAEGDGRTARETALEAEPRIHARTAPSSKPFGLRATSATDSERLIEQFYMLLESTFTRILDRGDPRVQQYAGTVDHIRQILDRTPPTWRGAYQVEQLLGVIYSDAELRVEIERRLVDAKALLGSDVYLTCQQEWEDLKQSDADDHRERCEVLYNRLLNDLQWRYEVRQLSREHQHNATIKTGLLFISAVVLFLPTVLIGPDFFEYLLENPNTPVESPSFVYLADHLFTSLTAGLLGATFSMLTGLRRRLDETSFKDLRTLSTWGYILTRGAIGLGAALIAYYFMSAELLQSGVFPAFDDKGEVVGKHGESLIVVWCFVAGFSEKLVPNLLSSTADSVQSSAGSETKS